MAGSDYEFPDVEFVETDTEGIVNELIQKYEQEFGRTLYPADPVRQLILWFASILSQERSMMNIAAKRNLPRYATGEYLDSLAEIFYGVTRMEAQPAKTVLKFTLPEILNENITVPEGTEATPNGEIYFATTEELVIKTGELTGIVDAECTEGGISGNGYEPGQINRLVDQLAYVASVENVTISVNGTDIESDDELYSRLRGSYEGYSTAGTEGAYQYHAQQHNSAVADVVVQELDPGQTGITVLMDSGIPSEADIADMQAYLSSDDIRPVTDQVIVSAPEGVGFDVNLTYYGSETIEPGNELLANLVETAVNEYIEWQTSKLGRKINPGKLIAMVISAGATYCEVTEPTVKKLISTQCAVLNAEPTLIYGGTDE
ncbi:MAG: baseplate J/gp47 family protein [Clostridia bacterium]|nr:baseplate J/gp47 family protein [Clostridia bacterium]